MSTVALSIDNEVLVCGLNNYSQVGSKFLASLANFGIGGQLGFQIFVSKVT